MSSLQCGKRGASMGFSNGWSVTMTKVGMSKDVRYFATSPNGHYHRFADDGLNKTTSNMDEIAAFINRIANGGGLEAEAGRDGSRDDPKDHWVPPEPEKERKAYPSGHCGCKPCAMCDEDFPVDHDRYDYYREEEEEDAPF